MRNQFDIKSYKFSPQGEPDQWLRFIRNYETYNALKDFNKDYFANALELGCGSGRNSKDLAYYCKRLVAMEYNAERLMEQGNDKITFIVGDAQDLSRFHDAEFDLVFSSNLIEHLSDPARCVQECARVTRRDGMIIHMVPNRMWKLFNLLLYYPFLIKTILCSLFYKNKTDRKGYFNNANSKQLDLNLRPLVERPLLFKLLSPKPHGISQGHLQEFRSFGRRRWINVFKNNGLDVVKIIRQPFYFGYEYNFRFILRLGNRLGLSACTGYVLRKSG